MLFLLSLIFIAASAWMLLKKYNPIAVLFSMGALMYFISAALNSNEPLSNLHIYFLDTVSNIAHNFSKTLENVGLMIMIIGGFVSYSKHIGSSEALVNLAIKPIQFLKKAPLLAASAIIPIGQLLFICIPSAAGLGMLLMLTVFPILIKLGVTKPTAVSAIALTTAIGVGPASALSASAANVLQMPLIDYFTQHQWKLFLILSLCMSVLFFFANQYYDKQFNELSAEEIASNETTKTAPKIFALLPVLPMVILVIFSGIIPQIPQIKSINTSNALLIGMVLSVIFQVFRLRNIQVVMKETTHFWDGMASIFKKAVVLIIAAESFAQGLISLGFIETIVELSNYVSASAIGLILTLLIFLTSVLMGSGNAAFFAFGPLIPGVAQKLNIHAVSLILKMNFAANLGRTVSPISGILIALSEMSGVEIGTLVKRNLIPVAGAFLFMLLFSSLTDL